MFCTHSICRDVIIRQTAPLCSSNSDCFPSGFTNSSIVPVSLVQCLSNGACFCNECFTRNLTTNKCFFEYPNCYYFDKTSGTSTCVDRRRSQVVAFVLSLTLAGVGAANFYIGQNGLAGGQLFLFIFVFVCICAVICLPCCSFCVIGAGKEEGVC